MDGPQTLKDQLDSIFSKMRHPFVYSFVSSWVVCNWVVVYLLIGGITKPVDTINEIHARYSFCSFGSWFHLFIFPLAGMIAYIYFGPKLLNWYLLYKLEGEIKSKFKEAELNKLEPVTRAEYNKLQNKYWTTASAYQYVRTEAKQILIPSRNQKIDIQKLVEEVEEASSTEQQLKAENANLKNDLMEAQVLIENMKKDTSEKKK